MEDPILKMRLKSLKEYYKELGTPCNSSARAEEEEKVSHGPTGLWGWFSFIRKKK